MGDVEKALQTFYSMKLKDIMPSIPSMPIVTADSPIVDVLKLLRTRHHVWVVNNRDEMKLEGVIRYLDVLSILLP
ncbi:MAG: hypothetical protein PWQ32_616, partial [Thermococcaceae archaeon]|nr:hypothetical protein [Thermococcaceae archaeon]